MDDGQHAHGEEPAPADAEHDEHKGPQTAKDGKEQRDDEYHGQADRQQTVGLDLPGVADSHHRSADKADVNRGRLQADTVGTLVQHVNQLTVVVGLTGSER